MSVDARAHRTGAADEHAFTFDATFSSLHLPSRDLAQSREFFVDILGGELTVSDAASVRVRIGDFEIVAGSQNGGGTPVGAEYPHFALTVTAEQFVGIKRRLDAYHVPTNSPWTRAGRKHSLMYFRDPTGNQFELFAPDGTGDLLPLRVGARAGGDYVIDFEALTYDSFERPADDAAAPVTRPTGFNHLTMPCRDLSQAKRFLVDVLGGVVTYNGASHVTASVGGADIGAAPQRGGWTGPDARYPHYTFLVAEPVLLAMKERLETVGVPTHAIATGNGRDALMYFRDPSGNLWKLLCRSASPRVLASAGREADVDVSALNYEWT
jgi:catechol 2,3-dioxygenase-like lactoylglutathione lyase family enzyme